MVKDPYIIVDDEREKRNERNDKINLRKCTRNHLLEKPK